MNRAERRARAARGRKVVKKMAKQANGGARPQHPMGLNQDEAQHAEDLAATMWQVVKNEAMLDPELSPKVVATAIAVIAAQLPAAMDVDMTAGQLQLDLNRMNALSLAIYPVLRQRALLERQEANEQTETE